MDSRIGWGVELFVWQRRRTRVCDRSRVGQAFMEAVMIRAARAMAKSLKRKSA
jgi:hypothetical protein